MNGTTESFTFPCEISRLIMFQYLVNERLYDLIHLSEWRNVDLANEYIHHSLPTGIPFYPSRLLALNLGSWNILVAYFMLAQNLLTKQFWFSCGDDGPFFLAIACSKSTWQSPTLQLTWALPNCYHVPLGSTTTTIIRATLTRRRYPTILWRRRRWNSGST